MAGAGAEFENRIQDWLKQYDTLTAEQKENVLKWFAMQKVIVENTELSAQEWFGHIEWAMDNPFDYSFIKEFPEPADLVEGDGAEIGDRTRSARRLVGADTSKSAPDGPGLSEKAKSEKSLDKELFDRFMSKGQLGRK